MRILMHCIGFLCFTMFAIAHPATATAPSEAPSEQLLIELEHDGIESYRLELFEIDGSRVFDSGLVAGAVAVELDPALRSRASDLRFEIRGWDDSGELVFSQLSTLGNDEIFSINFEVIPAGMTLEGSEIALEGNVNVNGELEVTGSVSTPQLVDELGGNFFGTCSAGQLAQGINSDGSLICAIDQTGADNLGNHVATTTLTMGANPISFNGSTEVNLRSTDNARFGTGPGGKTFFMQGGDSSSDAAFFKRHDELITLRISNEGRFKFLNGQKLCTAQGTAPHNTILVGEGWTSTTCNSFSQAVSGSSYRLGCLFETGTFFGSVNGGLPSPNCGW